LLRDLWHLEEESGTRVVDYLVKRLRKKLDENDTKVMIETVWGYGFRLNLKAG
jgi:DNA-binding response OmpR family regulator